MMFDAQTVVQRESRGQTPAVLRVEPAVPVPLVAVDSFVPFGVAGEDPEKGVGVAVARADRVVAAVPEVELPGIVGRPRFGLAVTLHLETELEVVPALR